MRAYNYPSQEMGHDAARRARGLDARQQQSAPSSRPLPSHTQQIMEAFLWNKKKTTRHEQHQQREVQSLILSRLQRPNNTENGRHPQEKEEVQPLVVPRQSQLNSVKNENNANNARWGIQWDARQPQLSLDNDEKNTQRMHWNWNSTVRPAVQPQKEVQPLAPTQSRLSAMKKQLRYSNAARPAMQPHQEEVQPLVPRQPPPRLSSMQNQNNSNNTSWNAGQQQPQLNSVKDENMASNTYWNHTMNEQATMNHRSSSHHQRGAHHQPSGTSHQQPLNIQIDEEEDIVCCDPGGGRCHEGTKNLCTLALWALIVFVIVNRFFVHMAMHLHKTESTVPKNIGSVIPKGTGSSSGVVVPLEIQPMEANADSLVVGNVRGLR